MDPGNRLLGNKEYRSGEHTLFIRCDRRREHRAFVRDVGLDHLAIRVEGRKQVEACYLRDPDGIPLEIAFY